MAQFRRFDEDTGSSEVQVAQLTARVTQLTSHLQVRRPAWPPASFCRWRAVPPGILALPLRARMYSETARLAGYLA